MNIKQIDCSAKHLIEQMTETKLTDMSKHVVVIRTQDDMDNMNKLIKVCNSIIQLQDAIRTLDITIGVAIDLIIYIDGKRLKAEATEEIMRTFKEIEKGERTLK